MDSPKPANWTGFHARVVKGHRVASGLGGDPRFPGGTLRMQQPFFAALGLDLSGFYPGTLNVGIAPMVYRVIRPKMTFPQVKWHPTAAAEDFSFFDVRLILDGKPPVDGLIYYPHPDTKPEHFQRADVLELLLPKLDGMDLDRVVTLEVPGSQMSIEGGGPV